jgi:hypothetical protein
VFDLRDSSNFNSSRPLNWLDRVLLAPIGAPTFTMVVILCTGLLNLSLTPGIYCMAVEFILSFFLCAAVFALLAVRAGMRRCIPKEIARPVHTARERIVWSLVLVTCLLVLLKVPLRISFLFARPQLDQIVSDVHNGRSGWPVGAQRAGPYIVRSSRWYGGDDTLFFELVDGDGGFAYCPTKGPHGYYNNGAAGHLGGGWYWWIDD